MNKIVCLVIMVFLSATMSVSAALIEGCWYDENTSTVQIYGTIDSNNMDKRVNIFLLDQGKTQSDIGPATNEDNPFLHIRMLKADDATGTYNYSFKVDGVSTENKLVVASGEQTSEINLSMESEIHIAKNGQDSNVGSMSSPIATVAEAQKRIRQRKELGLINKPVSVIIHGGTYQLSQPISLTAQDSGTATAPVYYKAAEGETVVFHGAKNIQTSLAGDVSNPTILNRIPLTARDKVIEVNLEEAAIAPAQYEMIIKSGEEGLPLGIYLNGKRQQIAQWPNNGFEAIGNIVDRGGKIQWTNTELNKNYGGVFNISHENAVKWYNAKDAYLYGYLGASFYKEWVKIGNTNTLNNQLTLANYSLYSLYDQARYKVLNLPEEIDLPGEWYIDKQQKKLYYYPPHTLTENDTFEIAVYRDSFITMDGVEYVNFENINFEKSYSDSSVYAIKATNVKNVRFNQCKVNDCAGSAIYINGENNTIENCDIYNIGCYGIKIEGGNSASLSPSGNVIKNNHIYNVSTDMSAHGRGNSINGVGNSFTNNVLHKSTATLLAYSGQNNQFTNNEIYNGTLEATDSGLIYSGRSFIRYGNQFLYNYMHDANYNQNITGSENNVLYWDDVLSGQTAIKNIIVPNNDNVRGVLQGGGRDNTLKFNTIVAAKEAIQASDWTSWYWNVTPGTTGTLQSFTQSAYNTIFSVPYDQSPWITTFPQVKRIVTELAKPDGTYNLFYPSYNKIFGNACFDYAQNQIASTVISRQGAVGDVGNNFEGTYISKDDASIFVNPAMQDYRIKNSAKASLGLQAEILDETFDINSIGMQRDISITNDSFTKFYPVNNAQINANEVELSWEAALFSDEYQYMIATDAAMTNIVSIGTTYEQNVSIQGLEQNKTYYWTVFAINHSRQFQNEWESTGGVYTFRTSNRVIEVQRATLYKSDNTYVASLSDMQENVLLQLNYRKQSNSPIDVKLIFCLYDNSNRLMGLQKETVNLSDNGSCTVLLNFGMQPQNGWRIKGYIWKDDTSIQPLSNMMGIW